MGVLRIYLICLIVFHLMFTVSMLTRRNHVQPLIYLLLNKFSDSIKHCEQSIAYFKAFDGTIVVRLLLSVVYLTKDADRND